MPDEVTTEDLEALLTDLDFLFLAREESRPNVFTTVAASTTEMWHSAFIRWVLDPGSHLGLGDFPLKRFLHAVLDHVVTDDLTGARLEASLSFADIEQLDFTGMTFETEYAATDLATTRTGGHSKLDIYGSIAPENDEGPSIQIVIENKVSARESEDQTDKYYRWASRQEYATCICVLMTPDAEQEARNPAFVQLTYQRFSDRVLWPIRRHPALSEESRYLLEQYMLNLNRNAKGECMAQVNKKVCVDVYHRYQRVFDQVYLAIGKEPPLADGSGLRLRRSAVTLGDLVNRGLLAADATLTSRYGSGHIASFTLSEEGMQIQVDNDTEALYPSLSKAASVITGRPTNGWTFWSTTDRDGNLQRLDTIRDRAIDGARPT